jgi:gamma-glutamyltranspeptidase/glutathione hydrolase
MDAQRAVALPHAVSLNNGTIELERDTSLANLAGDLKALGHDVTLNHQTSGLGLIQVVRRQGQTRLVGGADPRREGEALGD